MHAMEKLGLWVMLKAKAGKDRELAEFLRSAGPLVDAEPDTLAWYAIQIGPSTYGIFDTFETEAGRDAHLAGKVAAALMANAPELLAEAPSIQKIDLLAVKGSK
jgi:quinol monooxygenase YgiN